MSGFLSPLYPGSTSSIRTHDRIRIMKELHNSRCVVTLQDDFLELKGDAKASPRAKGRKGAIPESPLQRVYQLLLSISYPCRFLTG